MLKSAEMGYIHTGARAGRLKVHGKMREAAHVVRKTRDLNKDIYRKDSTLKRGGR